MTDLPDQRGDPDRATADDVQCAFAVQNAVGEQGTHARRPVVAIRPSSLACVRMRPEDLVLPHLLPHWRLRANSATL
jgi:hypothetical protein